MLACLCRCVALCINASVCLMLSFKCGNMLSLGIRASGSLKGTLPHCNFRKDSFHMYHGGLFNTNASVLLIHSSEKKRSVTALDGKDPPEPPLFSQAAAAGPPCLSRKPQMSGKPLDISANHSPRNKYFLNDLRDNETRVRPSTRPNKAPRLPTNLNPN